MKVKYTVVCTLSDVRPWVRWTAVIPAHNDSDALKGAQKFLREVEKSRVIGKGKNRRRLGERSKPRIVKIIKTEEIPLN